MEVSITWVGIDAHKKTLAVAVLRPGERVPEEFTIENEERAIRKLVRRLERGARGGEIRICYEAGPCGYVLQRRLEAAGRVVCEVIAPSLIPRKPGERVKTDRRDARKLVELFEAGLLTTVAPPTPEQEAVRDLCRCREDVRADLGRCRHRLAKFLVRRGYVFPGARLWGVAHRRWLDTVQFDNETDRIVVAEYKTAIEQAERRLRAMDGEIEKAAQLPLYREHVAWLRCFHGVDTTVAMIFVAELHGIDRFEGPRALAAYLGLVPSVHASGESTRHGSITKTGNGHIRRVLVQTAWQYSRNLTLGRNLRARREGQPEQVLTIADEARRRLTMRYRRLVARGKTKNKVVIALARELVGFFWAVMRADSNPARHGARSSTQNEGVKASAAPRSSPPASETPPTSSGPRSGPRLRKAASSASLSTSRTAVGQRRVARKEKRAI